MEEIDNDWIGVQKQVRLITAQAITRYCVGHTVEAVAKRLGYSVQHIRRQLDYAGIGAAIGGGSQLVTPPGKSGDKGVDHAVGRLVKDFSPAVTVKLNDDGEGNQSVATIEGDDAEEFEPYLDHYVEQGHEPAAATRLARAEWAAEAAVEAGVIKESKNKRDEKVNQILFPQDTKDTFDLDLKMHMARVKSAAAFLDGAKVRNLRRKSTCEKVAEADVAWKAQAELVLQHYQPSMEN